MEFEQSRFQDVFSRLYEEVCYALWWIPIIIIASMFTVELHFADQLVIGLIFTSVYLIYLSFKHNKGSRSLTFEEDTLIFRDNKLVTRIKWPDYEGYYVSNRVPYKINIENRIYGTTSFSYYTFSSSQRKQIFKRLDLANEQLLKG